MDAVIEQIDGGLEIIDPFERHYYQIGMEGARSLKHVEQSKIQYPVDTTVTGVTDDLVLPQKEYIYILDESGSIIFDIAPNEKVSLPHGSYTLDISTSLKIYIHVESELDIYAENEHTHIDLKSLTKVAIGVRSHHTQPTETITTTPEPTDLMRVVSTFGSALKTKQPERSFPTLRGHPPIVELGDDLDIPDRIEQQSAEIQIEIPPTLAHICVIVPLAYYTGAKVTPGTEPKLIPETGESFMLDTHGGFETTVEGVLRHIFLLDCVVRTEGPSPDQLYEREKIEPLLEFDIANIYQQPLTEQLRAYLDTPLSLLKPYTPSLDPKTRVASNKDTVEFLPFIAKNLSPVTVGNSQGKEGDLIIQDSTQAEGILQNPNKDSLPPTIQQIWEHKNTSRLTSTIPLAAYHNKIHQTPKGDPLEIDIVCNELDMQEELVTVYGTYGNRDKIPFDITIHHDLTIEELKEVLSAESDFVHYIGHIDPEGFRCADGELNASELKSINTKAFFLNACNSYQQGLALVDAGSIGGIVTFDDIKNNNAVSIGSTIARLLNYGYSLSAALDIARIEATVGGQYHIVGDAMTSVAQPKTGVPSVCFVNKKSQNKELIVELEFYDMIKKGGISSSNLGLEKKHYLTDRIGPISVTKAELIKFLDIGPIPVLLDGEMKWSDNIGLRDL